MDFQAIRDVVVTIGGMAGLASALYTLKRYRSEDRSKRVEARADELRRLAHEAAVAKGGSMMQFVPLELTSELDRKAAWKLCKEGHGSMKDNHVWVSVDLMPPMVAREMARRAAMHATDNFH